MGKDRFLDRGSKGPGREKAIERHWCRLGNATQNRRVDVRRVSNPPRTPPHPARYLVDPASSHMLVPKIKPCMSKYKPIYTVKLRMAH